MRKGWERFWWIFTALVLLGMLVFWLIPEPVSEGDATQTERDAVVTRVREAQVDFPNVRFDKMKAHGNRVVEMNATWIAKEAPAKEDRQAWNSEADKIASRVAAAYLPSGWHINVALWYSHLPRGVAGRVAGTGEGGPANLFRLGSEQTAPPTGK